MVDLIKAFLAAIRVFFRSRVDNSLEVLALRQQVAVFKRKRPRPALTSLDRLFWTTLRQYWPRWSDVLAIVKPETVVVWHRAGFRLYWRWRSRPRPGRPKISEELRTLIHRMAIENSGWGAPRIHGDLRKLGFEISERTVARYLRRLRRRGDASRRWIALLANHREAIVAMDFFAVPTLTFKAPVLFLRDGARAAPHPAFQHHQSSDSRLDRATTAGSAFPKAGLYRYIILDHDSKFDAGVIAFLKATGLQPKRTSVQAPWQNGIAERWVGSCRREILDHVIALSEPHLRRLMRDYVNYRHNDRIHDSLDKDTPHRRPVESKPSPNATVISSARLGGIHHRYSWRKAA
jgi:putative transposase